MLKHLSRKFTLPLVVGLLVVITAVVIKSQTVEAACPATDTSRGTVTSQFTVDQAGTYTVWSRIMPSGTNDSYTLEIDGTTCGITVGNANTSATGWQWVNYRDGNTSSKITVSLAAGSHSMTMIGKEDNVQIDRVMFLSDSCTPSGTGDNCVTVADTTPPTVSITQPANNATVSGTQVIQATAADNVAVSRVDFYMGSSLLVSDQTAPYSFTLNASSYPAGTYQLTARAYDTATPTPLSTTSQVVNITIPPPADTTKPTVGLTAPANGGTYSGNITVSATASDNVAVSKVDILVDNVVKTSLTNSPYTYVFDSKSVANGSHTITARAYDSAPTPNQNEVTVSVTINNTVTPPPTQCDFDGDGKVGIVDLSILLSNFNTTVTRGKNGDCDANTDGVVGIIDLSTLLTRWTP